MGVDYRECDECEQIYPDCDDNYPCDYFVNDSDHRVLCPSCAYRLQLQPEFQARAVSVFGGVIIRWDAFDAAFTAYHESSGGSFEETPSEGGKVKPGFSYEYAACLDGNLMRRLVYTSRHVHAIALPQAPVRYLSSSEAKSSAQIEKNDEQHESEINESEGLDSSQLALVYDMLVSRNSEGKSAAVASETKTKNARSRAAKPAPAKHHSLVQFETRGAEFDRETLCAHFLKQVREVLVKEEDYDSYEEPHYTMAPADARYQKISTKILALQKTQASLAKLTNSSRLAKVLGESFAQASFAHASYFFDVCLSVVFEYVGTDSRESAVSQPFDASLRLHARNEYAQARRAIRSLLCLNSKRKLVTNSREKSDKRLHLIAGGDP